MNSAKRLNHLLVFLLFACFLTLFACDGDNTPGQKSDQAGQGSGQKSDQPPSRNTAESAFPGADSPFALFNTDPRHPFAATGLTLRPDESAEEILLRAHMGDTGAIGLAVAGYSFGIGGFPYAPELARHWIWGLTVIDAPQAAHYFQLFTFAGKKLSDEEKGSVLAYCDISEECPLGPLFNEAGIFDAPGFCASLTENQPYDLRYQESYNQIFELMPPEESRYFNLGYGGYVSHVHTTAKKPGGYIEYSRKTLRGMVAKPASKVTQYKLFAPPELRGFERYLVFFAATTHDIETGPSDWSDERLAEFISLQRESAPALSPSERDEIGSLTLKDLLAVAESMMENRREFDTERALKIIRRAHSGDPNAACELAELYENNPCLLVHPAIYRQWRYQAALAGDVSSILAEIDSNLETRFGTLALPWGTLLRRNKQALGQEQVQKRLAALAELEKELDANQKRYLAGDHKALLEEARLWKEATDRVRKNYAPRN